MKIALAAHVALASGMLLTVEAAADSVFGVYAGASAWQQEAAGDVASFGAAIDVEDDLGLGDEQNNVYFLALEHGVPVLPNVRFQYLDIELAGANTLTRDIEFNGVTFPVSTSVTSAIDAKQTNAVLYYEVLDNVVSLDLGLDVRYLDGRTDVNSEFETSGVDFQIVVPLPYVRARIDLPLTGLWLSGEVSGVTYSGDSLYDADVALGWESPIGLGVQAGYRMFRLDVGNFDDVDQLDVSIAGPYAGINFHF